MAAILAAPVAMEYQTGWWPATPSRHGQRVLDQAGLHVRLQAPAHHVAAEQVDDGGQVQPAFVGLDVGDVATPELVGASGLKRRCTRSGATGRLWRLSVVTTNLRFVLALMPCCCMSLRTRSLPTRMPRATSSLCMRGQPYLPLTSAWMARMCASRASSLWSRPGPLRP